jgi:hypothetical protein
MPVVGERKGTLQMLGEFLREVAVLVLVFVPIDLFSHNLTWMRFIYTLVGSCVILVFGVAIERLRS